MNEILQGGVIIPAIPTSSGGTSDYGDLTGKPRINGHELQSGDNTSADLGLEKPYISLERLRRYLYRITFDKLPAPADGDYSIQGACSAFVRDGKLFRNFDFRFNDSASFIIRTRDFEGMAFISGLEDGELDDAQLAQLPYRVVDGCNVHGIMVSTHILFNDWQWTGSGERNIPLMRLPSLVLSEVVSMATMSLDLANVLGNLVAGEAMGDYLIQILVTDGTTTKALIPPTSEGQPYVIQDITDFPKLTNFRPVGRGTVSRSDADMQTRPTGVERYNLMPCELPDLRFTEAYESADRLSEFVGIDETTKDSTDAELTAIYQLARAEYLRRERDGKTWHTMHSVVYGDRMESLYIQEHWDDECSGSLGAYRTAEEQDIIDEGKQDIISDLADIRSNAAAGAAAAQGIQSIEDKIPAQATSTNKLADKAFVNSSIQTATSNFRGNWEGWNHVPDRAGDYPEDYAGSRKPTVNDYLVVRDTHLFDIEKLFPLWDEERSYEYGKGVQAEDPETGDLCYWVSKVSGTTAGEFNTDEWVLINITTDISGNPTYLGYGKTEGPAYENSYLIAMDGDPEQGMPGMLLGRLTFDYDAEKWNAEAILFDGDETYIEMSALHEGTWRFKYSGDWDAVGKDGWLPEYQVNETPMTAAQLAALNSNITEEKVNLIPSQAKQTAWDNKQNALTAGTGISIVGNVISADKEIAFVSSANTYNEVLAQYNAGKMLVWHNPNFSLPLIASLSPHTDFKFGGTVGKTFYTIVLNNLTGWGDLETTVAEAQEYKISSITSSVAGSTIYYPSVKGMVDYVDSVIITTINEDY